MPNFRPPTMLNDQNTDTPITEMPALDALGIAGTIRYVAARVHDLKVVHTAIRALRATFRSISWALGSAALVILDFRSKRKLPTALTSISASEKTPITDIESESSPKPQISQTKSGARIVDKRRISAKSESAIIDFEDSTPNNNDSRANEPSRRVLETVSNAGLRLLGHLIQLGFSTAPQALNAIDLGRFVLHSRPCQIVLRDKSDPENWQEMLALISGDAIGDWRVATTGWITNHVPPTTLVEFLQERLTPQSIGGMSDRQLTSMLRIAEYVVPMLPDEQAKQIFSIALTQSRKAVNPYESNGVTLVARRLVAAMLEQRPNLDEQILNTLVLQRTETRDDAIESLPVEVRLLAIALRNRSRSAQTLMAAAEKASLNRRQLMAAARLADATLIRHPRVRDVEPPRAPMSFIGIFGRRLVPWIGPPLLAGTTGVVSNIIEWSKPSISVALGESIALLALIVTVHVFTVTLSATRLPGVVSRSAGQPWVLLFSYSSVLTVLGLVLFRPAEPTALNSAISWATVVALVMHVGSLLASMFMLLRRTDAARAAQGYVTATLPLARASGRRFGRIQATAADLREALETIPFVSMSSDSVIGEWSHEVTARKRGFFLPTRSGLRHLLKRSAFNRGVMIRFISGLGTIVDRNTITATLSPSRDVEVPRDLVDESARRLTTQSSKDVEAIATGAVALTQLTFDLMRAGDLGTAHAVAQQVVILVTEHLRAIRKSRKKHFRRQALRSGSRITNMLRVDTERTRADVRARDQEFLPVVPALRDVLRVAIRERLRSDDDNFDIPESIVEPLLSSSLRPEAAVSILTFGVPADPDEVNAAPQRMVELLRVAGVRALELRDSIAFSQVLDQLKKVASHESGRSDAIGITSVLAATACRFDPSYARSATDALLTEISTVKSSIDTELIAARHIWRIGAAAYICGSVSMTVYVAVKICEYNKVDRLLAWASNEEIIITEKMHSGIRGGYLGDDATAALTDFANFTADWRETFN